MLGWDSILNIHYKANWYLIKNCKQDLINKITIVKNTSTTKETKNYLKLRGKFNSNRMRIWILIQLQLSEIMSLLRHVKLKSQTLSILTTLLRAKNKLFRYGAV